MDGAALLLVLLVAAVPLSAAGDAHPGYSDEGTCTVDAGACAGAELRRLEERGGRGRIIDITHAYVPDLPAFATGAVTGPVVPCRCGGIRGEAGLLSRVPRASSPAASLAAGAVLRRRRCPWPRVPRTTP